MTTTERREHRRIARMMNELPIRRVRKGDYYNPTVPPKMKGEAKDDGVRLLENIAIAMIVLVLVLAFAKVTFAEEHPATMYVCVSESSWLNGRAEPDAGSRVEAKFYAGYDVAVYEVKDGWARVQGGETGSVWCRIDYLSSTRDDPRAYTVTANGRVRVRDVPDGRLVRWLDDGDSVTVTRWCESWAYVGDGYVDGRYLEAEE